ncbi:MAG: hypothetical protein Q9165_005672 [Trypethelium subeluteriae]
MPRKQYLCDLEEVRIHHAIPNISDVAPGDESGQFSFLYTSPNLPPVSISALIPDVSEYPTSHSFMVFAGENAPPEIAASLEELRHINGKSISQLLEIISRSLSLAHVDQDGDTYMPDSQVEEDSEEDDFESDDEDDWGMGIGPAPANSFASTRNQNVSMEPGALSEIRSRVRLDLQTAKDAGFKVGVHGRIMEGGPCVVSISCRVAKLGVSHEAMQAWQLDRKDYLILLIQYSHGYTSLDKLMSCGTTYHTRERLEMRVGKSSTYKPSHVSALRAFSNIAGEGSRRLAEANDSENSNSFENIFISKPLNQLLNERLLAILRYRFQGMGWEGAEAFYDDHQAANASRADVTDAKYLREDTMKTDLSALLWHDHIREQNKDYSLPLAGMQFLLRHVVRCTEFCLVCHCRLQEDLEAIKPYVCDKPLCLYQYMSLGFGPSIEHEIIAQPHVVDLLISFCYTRAQASQLQDFPLGLSLSVPSYLPAQPSESDMRFGLPAPLARHPSETDSTKAPSSEEIPMRFDRDNLEMIFDNKTTCPVRKGEWIVIESFSINMSLHLRVDETAFYPVVKLSEPVAVPKQDYDKNVTGKKDPAQTEAGATTLAGSSAFLPASFIKYDRNFDELSKIDRCSAICRLLDTLPKVSEMREYLTKNNPAELKDWVVRISPAALGILRWIIASNRACIIQVDTATTAADEGSPPMTKSVEDRVHGMAGWMQFRFAMGAPDKEKRFRNAVKSTADRLDLKYPTLFAWHGSPLSNWHSIIREGLHFKQATHGRAYGDGCYHSMDINTSLTYSSGLYPYAFGGSSGRWQGWAQTELKITSALSMNEIVNAPKEFVNRSPHLVVAQLDWIQTRYLFVKGKADVNICEGSRPSQEHQQDPKMTPSGTTGKIVIPATAVSLSRRTNAQETEDVKGKAKGTSIDPILIEGISDDDDDAASVTTLSEDRSILEDNDTDTDADADAVVLRGASNTKENQPPTSCPKPPDLMDFTPGSLTKTTLPLLASPDYATAPATKRLQSDLRALLKLQSSTAPHELGWHLDASLLSDNLYQWIIQLHSFPSTLPLAADLSRAALDSVVCELRFPPSYPLAPPFVRVIRPRFLPFLHGGGGHVTAGGALCMELLTNSGWSPASSMESVLLQVRLAIMSTEPRPARLERRGGHASGRDGGGGSYGEGEAMEAYVRACAAHGWEVSEGFKEMRRAAGWREV